MDNRYLTLLLLPFVTRTILLVSFARLANKPLSTAELAVDVHRQHIFSLAGFSFTAGIAVAVLERTLRASFTLPLACLMFSFLVFLFSLNIQSYKATRWQDQLGTAATECGYLAMIVAVASLVLTEITGPLSIVLAILAITIWGSDHCIRLLILSRYLGVLNERSRHRS